MKSNLTISMENKSMNTDTTDKVYQPHTDIQLIVDKSNCDLQKAHSHFRMAQKHFEPVVLPETKGAEATIFVSQQKGFMYFVSLQKNQVLVGLSEIGQEKRNNLFPSDTYGEQSFSISKEIADNIHFLVKLPLISASNLTKEAIVYFDDDHFTSFSDFVASLFSKGEAKITLPVSFFDNGKSVISEEHGIFVDYLSFSDSYVFSNRLMTKSYHTFDTETTDEIALLLSSAVSCTRLDTFAMDTLRFVGISAKHKVLGVSNNSVFVGNISDKSKSFFEDILSQIEGNKFCTFDQNSCLLLSQIIKKSSKVAYKTERGYLSIALPLVNAHDRWESKLSKTDLKVSILADDCFYFAYQVQNTSFPQDEVMKLLEKRNNDWIYRNLSSKFYDRLVGEIAKVYSENPRFFDNNDLGLKLIQKETETTTNLSINFLGYPKNAEHKILLDDTDFISSFDLILDKVFGLPYIFCTDLLKIQPIIKALKHNKNILVQIPFEASEVQQKLNPYRKPKQNILRVLCFNNNGDELGIIYTTLE